MKRRTLTLGLTASLVGCGRSVDGPRPLRFSWWGGSARHAATLQVVRLFEQRNPKVRIKAEYMGFGGYLERLTTQIAGRSEPDVMQINWAWMAMLSKRGTGFANLQPLLGQNLRQQLSAGDQQSGLVAGLLNALPVSYSARVMLWNEGSFKQRGAAIPSDWPSLFDAGEVFKRTSSGQAFPLDGELYDMILLSHAWMQQKYGLAYMTLHEQNTQIAISKQVASQWCAFYKSLVDKHVCTSLPLRASLGGAEKPTEQQPDWVAGRWAGNYTWDTVIGLRSSTLPKGSQLTLGGFPLLPSAQQTGMFGRPALMFAVSKNSKAPEAGLALIEFMLTDPDAVRILGRTRGLPLLPHALASLQAEKSIPPLEWQAYQQIQAQRERGAIPLPAPLFEHPRMQKFMREVFEQLAYNKISSDYAGERLVSMGQALLNRLK